MAQAYRWRVKEHGAAGSAQKEAFDPQLKLNVILSLQMENLMLKAQIGTLREMLEFSRREREEIELQLKTPVEAPPPNALPPVPSVTEKGRPLW